MPTSESEQFLQLYQRYRYNDQLTYYASRQEEFSHAQDQAMACSIGLIFLAALAAAFETLPLHWLQYTCLLAAAICPVLSTALTAYSALYSFEQQGKLYQDAIHSLEKLRVQEFNLQQAVGTDDFTAQLHDYVAEVEQVFQIEHGQWGQVAKNMKPPEI